MFITSWLDCNFGVCFMSFLSWASLSHPCIHARGFFVVLKNLIKPKNNSVAFQQSICYIIRSVSTSCFEKAVKSTHIFLPQKNFIGNVVKSSFCARQGEKKSSTIDEKNSICTKNFWERSKSFFFLLKFSSIVCFWLSLQMLSLTSVKYELKWYYRCVRSLFMATAFKMFASHFSCRYSWKKKSKDVNRLRRKMLKKYQRTSYARIFMYSWCWWACGLQNKLIKKMWREGCDEVGGFFNLLSFF